MRVCCVILLLSLLLGAQSLFAMAPANEGANADGLALVQAKCSACHGLDRVCKRLGMNASFWDVKIMSMIKQWGMDDPGEASKTAMAGYLGGLQAGDPAICK